MKSKKINFIFPIFMFVFASLANSAMAANVEEGSHYTIDSGCAVSITDSNTITCKDWQRGSQAKVENIDVGTCICANTCLPVPESHYYYDDPINKTKQTNENEITLPVVLAWDNIEAWQKEDGEYLWNFSGLTGKESVTSKLFGARSYVLEIENKNGELNDSQSAGDIFRRVLTTTEFNPTKEFYPCFFNSDTTIKWRILPCCNEDGSNCRPEDQTPWWTFRTSPAPEPIYASNVKDPDWNGPDGGAGISFNNLRLDWCHAKVSPEKAAYNENMNAALSYQLRVYANENQLVLTGAQIPARFSQLAAWLKKDVPAVSPLACHYLEKQTNNTCKADVVNPIQAKTPRNWWSHQEIPNQDRALFTQGETYSWQLRRCFNNSNAGEENCNSQSDKYWGQLWKFTTKTETVSAPTLLSPANDANYNDSQTANLAELPGRLLWQAPNGANSFSFDIQKISDASATSLVDNDRRTTKSQIFFSKTNAADSNSDSAGIELELDTAYKWRAKSCWPAIPVGDVCDEPWSGWWYFRTTGRAAKTESLQPADNASELPMPVNLQWESVAGAKSYILDFNGQKTVLASNQYTLDYPAINQSQSYKWKVQTCADAAGQMCGPATPEFTFATAALKASEKPVSPLGTIDNSQLIYNFSWEPAAGAHYYKFTLNYAAKSEKETNNQCQTGQKVEKTVNESKTTVSNDIAQMYCLGSYKWKVLACLDKDCKDAGAEPQTWNFNFIAGGKEIKKGETIMAVCGLTNDNPNTEWDDREKCGLKHFLLNVMQIINLVLFKMAFWLLPLLGLATGGLFFTSFGTPELKQKVISWWKIIGLGYALLFFAWLLVGFFTSLFGYTGVWWNI
jgi:hypothetical protein